MSFNFDEDNVVHVNNLFLDFDTLYNFFKKKKVEEKVPILYLVEKRCIEMQRISDKIYEAAVFLLNNQPKLHSAKKEKSKNFESFV